MGPSTSKALTSEPPCEDPPTPRQPLQLIQQPYSRHSSNGGSSEPATPQAVTSLSVFFGSSTISGETSSGQAQPDAVPPVASEAPVPSSSTTTSGSGNGSRVAGSGVVRRKSWRTHYVRPHKSFEQAELGTREVRFIELL